MSAAAAASEMSAAAATSSVPRPIKALVLDFDSTISTPTFLKRTNCWCVADNVELFRSMTEEEILANFGGMARVKALEALLRALAEKGVVLHIVSIGYKAAIVPHLKAVGLLRFFDDERIWGQDCRPLREFSYVKGRLIGELIMRPNGWQSDDCLFVDDSKDHIDNAAPICRTLLVTSKATVGGMGEYELSEIRRAAGLPGA
jgi:phosphoglycolate phosphatase-like HAD superfamily hydrolase